MEQIKVKDFLELVTDAKVYFEIVEKISGASFGICGKQYIQKEFLEKDIKEINVQYIDNKRLVVIKF